ncbi:MAG: ankyrin repeat domain-containing protein [Pseudomonadota bacterium]|nr:ankyrin repeat domain-containing protein [Pseudomonadota bacterium]
MPWFFVFLLALAAGCAQTTGQPSAADAATAAPKAQASAVQPATTARPSSSVPAYGSPLLTAAFSNNVAVLRDLLSRAGASQPADALNRSALHAAASGGALEAARLLLEHGMPVDAKDSSGATPLMYAINQKRPALAELLLQKGADPNAMTSDGHQVTPLTFALNLRDYASMHKLLAAGARPEAAEKPSFLVTLTDWKTALGVASLYKRKLDLSESEELALLTTLSRRADWPQLLKARGTHQETSLMVAAEGAPASIVKFLLDHGADTAARDSQQLIASDWALMANRSDVYCLIKSRQDPQTQSGLTSGGHPLPAKDFPRCPGKQG